MKEASAIRGGGSNNAAGAPSLLASCTPLRGASHLSSERLPGVLGLWTHCARRLLHSSCRLLPLLRPIFGL